MLWKSEIWTTVCCAISFKILMFYQKPKTSSHWKLNKKKRKQRMMNLNNRERQSLLKLFKLKKRENLLTLEDRNRWVILTKLLKSLVVTQTTTILTSSFKQLCVFFGCPGTILCRILGLEFSCWFLYTEVEHYWHFYPLLNYNLA